MSGARNGARVVRRVPPLQGGDGLIGPSSQGVALGYRVVAPLARNSGGAIVFVPDKVSHARRMRSVFQPEGLQPISPGQRPGNPAANRMISPERAEPGGPPAQARGLEQTIADNVAEILEA